MKGWRRFSLYHVLKDRRDSWFIKKTFLDFVSGLAGYRELDLPIAGIIYGLSIIPMIYFNWTLGTWILVDVVVYALVAIIISGLDTYGRYNVQVRREAIKSIELIIGMTDRRRR